MLDDTHAPINLHLRETMRLNMRWLDEKIKSPVGGNFFHYRREKGERRGMATRMLVDLNAGQWMFDSRVMAPTEVVFDSSLLRVVVFLVDEIAECWAE